MFHYFVSAMKLLNIKLLSIIFLFVLIGFGVYSNTFDVPFHFDDSLRIKENPHIRIENLSFNNIKKAAFSKRSSQNRPIGNITFALNYYFHQYNVFGYHIVNIIVHLLTGFFLYLFIKITLSLPALKNTCRHNHLIALFSALIWLTNPVQTQSVTYIVQRLNSMSAMFYIIAFLLYVKGRISQKQYTNQTHQNKRETKTKEVSSSQKHKSSFSFYLPASTLYFSGSALAWILSLGCKQISVTLPVFIFIYEWYFFQDLSKDWFKSHLKYITVIFVLLSALAILFLIHYGANPWDAYMSRFSRQGFTPGERLLTQFRVLIYYISLILYPHPARLNLDYDFPLSHSLINPISTFPALLAILGLITLALYLAKKNRLISFCILWFFGNLVIESSIIPLAIIFEHRLYLPSMLAILIPVILMYRYIKLKWLTPGLLCIVLAVFSIWTFQRNKVWSDSVSLWGDCVIKSPNKARPHSNLGQALINQGKIDEAIKHCFKALEIKPDFPGAHINIGHALEKKEKYNEAIDHYLKALEIKPDYAKAYYNMGLIRSKQGLINEAFDHYYKALKIRPDFPELHLNIGVALVKHGKTDEAINHYLKALQMSPYFAEAHNNLGIVLVKKGETDKAIGHYTKAIQIKPDFADAHNNLGFALAARKKPDEAIENYLKALQIKPDYADAHNNLGITLIEIGKTDEAIKHYSKALSIKPDYVDAHNNLGLALAEQGKTDEAIEHYNEILKIDPDYTKAYFNLGVAFGLQGRSDEAIHYYNKALQMDPEMEEAHNNLGVFLMQSGKTDAAIAHFKKALEIKPDYDDAKRNLNTIIGLQKNIEQDIAKIQKELKNNPNDPAIHYVLGKLFYGKGELKKAEAQYQKALDLQPEFAEALNALAVLYAKQKEYGKAISIFKKMTTFWPDYANTYYNIACMYSRQNNIENSIEWLKLAVKKGYKNWDLIKTDKDLENIRGSLYYNELIKG